MKKLFITAFILMFSFTSAFAGDDHQTRDLNRNEESDTGGGGGGTSGDFIFIVFKGWCGQAHIEVKFNYEPSWMEIRQYEIMADQWCDLARTYLV